MCGVWEKVGRSTLSITLASSIILFRVCCTHAHSGTSTQLQCAKSVKFVRSTYICFLYSGHSRSSRTPQHHHKRIECSTYNQYVAILPNMIHESSADIRSEYTCALPVNDGFNTLIAIFCVHHRVNAKCASNIVSFNSSYCLVLTANRPSETAKQQQFAKVSHIWFTQLILYASESILSTKKIRFF